MHKVSITCIEVSFFAHATEDKKKVTEAIKHLLPENQLERIFFARNLLRGHHGNSITVFESKIKEKDIIDAVASNLSSNLGVLDKQKLRREMRLHLGKGSLYLRFDKQAAYLGRFTLGVADPIRFRFRFNLKKSEDILSICRKIGIFT